MICSQGKGDGNGYSKNRDNGDQMNSKLCEELAYEEATSAVTASAAAAFVNCCFLGEATSKRAESRYFAALAPYNEYS